MLSFEQIHTGLPNLPSVRQNVPPSFTLERYAELTQNAYKQAGISLEDGTQCPGIEAEDGSKLRIGATLLAGFEYELAFVAQSKHADHVTQGRVGVSFGRVSYAEYLARNATHSTHPFAMTQTGWNTLNTVIRQGLESEAFKPVEKKLVLDRAVPLSGHSRARGAMDRLPARTAVSL